jgi:hypothetical protein
MNAGSSYVLELASDREQRIRAPRCDHALIGSARKYESRSKLVGSTGGLRRKRSSCAALSTPLFSFPHWDVHPANREIFDLVQLLFPGSAGSESISLRSSNTVAALVREREHRIRAPHSDHAHVKEFSGSVKSSSTTQTGVKGTTLFGPTRRAHHVGRPCQTTLVEAGTSNSSSAVRPCTQLSWSGR